MTESSADAVRVHAPEFRGAVEWFNVPAPLTLRSLRGKVVLVDFWTYGCVNCMHTLRDLKRLADKYRDALVVVGMHSAKFSNERQSDNIRRIIVRYEIEHPVANDADFVMWKAYGARAWPTQVLIDPDGYVVAAASGEGHAEGFDRAIAAVIHVFDEQRKIDRRPLLMAPERAGQSQSILAFPGKVIADEASGRLFVADSSHHRILVTTIDGQVTEVIGRGPPADRRTSGAGRTDGAFADATFDRPQGLAFDALLIASDALVKITYAEPACPSTTSVVSLPVLMVRGQPTTRPASLKLPEGSSLPSPTTVHVRGVVDLTGAVRYLAVADGPAELEAAALTAAAEWHVLPFRVNGTPVPQSVTLGLTFASPVRPSTGLAPAASSTVGGRSTEDETTADESGLSATTSRCARATDATYGFAAANPVKVGGDWRIGPSRERTYLEVLRGPAGEGLHFVRPGSTMGPDRQTILDLYEITYAGLAQAIRLYVDEYHFEDLKAPVGFACAAPFNIK